MILKNYKSFRFLIISVGIAYVLHKLIFYFFKISQETFYYSIEKLYCIFFILSVLIFLILLKVKERSFEQLGMFFLFLSSIKIIFYYMLLRPILKISHYDTTTEKVNFFVLFILFLTIETLLTIRILSEKE
ncbi:hypothetical protein EOD40_02430 [Flavobacterium sufflavum]|uniref:Uncharacterized protein n=1 Tax=Flavobacterium sufflavum TaxID=1921138 RepID=A0A3S2V806_9FLAO|nr:hypothetical protein EOD40_02430 [Flavobacterium sufflavum]